MKILITGGCGFLGSNLAQEAISRGDELYVFDNLSRLGAQLNLSWLRQRGEFTFIHGDIRNKNDVTQAVQSVAPEAIFHLAGQVAMTTSIANPQMDFEINVLGSHNVLEAVRLSAPQCAVLYSSTNKVYGDLNQFDYHEAATRYVCTQKPGGFDEDTQLNFSSPYGCSKGAADQYMLDYARIFGLKTVVFRHSSMYGGRQFATYDQGWVGWFCQKAVEAQRARESAIHAAPTFTISGNGKQVRDVLHADDMRRLYFSALEQIDSVRGMAFNIGGGVDNSLSLLELFELLGKFTGIRLKYDILPPRSSDQKVFVADLAKVRRHLGWLPEVSATDGVRAMVEWTRAQVLQS